jgi:hypothetical protein
LLLESVESDFIGNLRKERICPAYEGGQAQRQREHRDTKGNGLLGNTAKAFSKLGAESYRSNVTAEGTSLSM